MIDLNMQIKSILFSFIYGILISFLFNINYFLLLNRKKIIKIFSSIFFVFDFSLLYFYVLEYINFGYIHFYLILFFICGFAIFYIPFKKKFRKKMSKKVKF